MKPEFSSSDITNNEAFQQVDAMVSAFDAEGDGPLRKGEAAFNWGLVEELCLPLTTISADLRVGIWLLRAALSEKLIHKVLPILVRIAAWTKLPKEQLHPLPIDDEDDIHSLILAWLASPAFTYAMGQVKVKANSELTLTALEAEDSLTGELQESYKAVLALQIQDMLQALSTIEKHMFDGYNAEGHRLIRVCQLLERCLKKLTPPVAEFSDQSVNQEGALSGYVSGRLNTRNDVRQMLCLMVAYFQTHEPSHPAPIFLNRVQRMLGANFQELLDELYPDAQNLIAQLERPKSL